MDQSQRDRQFRGWLAEAVDIVSRELCRSRPRIVATHIEREAAVLTVDGDSSPWAITVKVRPDRRLRKWSIRRTSAAWHLHKADETESLRSDFYALVDFASDSRQVYIVPGAVVADALRKSDQEWHRQDPTRRDYTDRWLASDYSALDQSLRGYPDGWLETSSDRWDLLHGAMRAPDVVTIDKGHGRLERRELWTVNANDLGLYLQQDFGWPRVRQVGWIRRFRRRTHERTWTEVTTHTWISSVAMDRAGPEEMALLLRNHWAIENGLHWVRDVTWDEDRLHGRAIGINLAAVRNTAINLIRTLGFAYIPDGWRHSSARRDYGWSTLTTALKK